MRTRAGVLAIALSLALPVSGCGDPADGDATSVDWAASAAPVHTDGLIWANAAGVIHLADGSTLDAQTPIASYVVAGDGAYVVPEGTRRLVLVTPDGVDETGAHLDPDTLKASPDGRYLLFLDPESGERGRYGDPLMQAVVVDLDRGEEVVRTSEKMGDPGTDDLRDLYEDAPPGTLGITHDTAYVHAPSDVLTVGLSGGEVTAEDVDEVFSTTQPWYSPRYQDDLNGGPWNPSRTWAIDRAEPRDRFVSGDGRRVEVIPGTPTWSLSHWIDDHTAVGFAVHAPPDDGFLDQQAETTLMTCTVPDGACTLVPEAAGPPGSVLLPNSSLL